MLSVIVATYTNIGLLILAFIVGFAVGSGQTSELNWWNIFTVPLLWPIIIAASTAITLAERGRNEKG